MMDSNSNKMVAREKRDIITQEVAADREANPINMETRDSEEREDLTVTEREAISTTSQESHAHQGKRLTLTRTTVCIMKRTGNST